MSAEIDTHRVDRLSTESLLTDLRGIEEAPWAVIRRGEPLDARGLAQRLRKYDIKPDLQRVDDQVSRGYTRAQFADAWSRYLLADPPQGSATSVTAATDTSDTKDTRDLSASTRARVSVCGCGNQLMSETSITRGYCERCRLDTKGDAA
jgi:hypothetical protein